MKTRNVRKKGREERYNGQSLSYIHNGVNLNRGKEKVLELLVFC